MNHPPVVFVPVTDQKPGIWRGGQLQEIFLDPPKGDYPDGDYRLWVGTATIERSADYSYFPHAERLHILLCGDGLRLHFREPEETVPLTSQEFYTFSGTRPLHAEVLGAPVFAFNLIYRQGLTSGAAFLPLTNTPHIHTIHAEAGSVRTQIVYLVSGSVAVEIAGEKWLMGPGDTLFWDMSGPSMRLLCLQSQTAEALLLLTHVAGPSAHPTTSA